MKIFNNLRFRLSNHRKGDCHTHILNNIKKGDKWIDGCGTLHICTFVDRKEDGHWGGMVQRVMAKTDGTAHKGCKAESFTKWRGVWEQKK